MNSKLLAVISAIILLSVGFVYVRNQQTLNKEKMIAPVESMEKAEDSMVKPTDAMMEDKKTENDTVQKDEGTMMKNESRYVVYSKSAFDLAAGKKRVLFFHAPWCPTCRPADAAFQKNESLIPADVVLFKTDYDSSTDLKKKYAVTYQHTFVQVDSDGNEVSKWNGGGITELTANIK